MKSVLRTINFNLHTKLTIKNYFLYRFCEIHSFTVTHMIKQFYVEYMLSLQNWRGQVRMLWSYLREIVLYCFHLAVINSVQEDRHWWCKILTQHLAQWHKTVSVAWLMWWDRSGAKGSEMMGEMKGTVGCLISPWRLHSLDSHTHIQTQRPRFPFDGQCRHCLVTHIVN